MSQLKHLQQNWEDLATLDPLWAICYDKDKQHGKWDIDEFFASGVREIDVLFALLAELGIQVVGGTALDFGCGIGRLTQALAPRFDLCYGVDISPTMIDLARKYNRSGDRCAFLLNTEEKLSKFSDNQFDFINTSIVLQHMSPELMMSYLREFVRVLKVGGIMAFQVPIVRVAQDPKSIYLRALPRYHPHRVLNVLRHFLLGDGTSRFNRLSRLGFSKKWLYNRFGYRPRIDMNYLDLSVIESLMKECGGRILRVQIDNEKSGPEMLSALFVATKII